MSGGPVDNLGREITVTRLSSWMGEPCWIYEGEDIIALNGERAHAVLDRCLLPLPREGDADPERLNRLLALEFG